MTLEHLGSVKWGSRRTISSFQPIYSWTSLGPFASPPFGPQYEWAQLLIDTLATVSWDAALDGQYYNCNVHRTMCLSRSTQRERKFTYYLRWGELADTDPNSIDAGIARPKNSAGDESIYLITAHGGYARPSWRTGISDFRSVKYATFTRLPCLFHQALQLAMKYSWLVGFFVVDSPGFADIDRDAAWKELFACE